MSGAEANKLSSQEIISYRRGDLPHNSKIFVGASYGSDCVPMLVSYGVWLYVSELTSQCTLKLNVRPSFEMSCSRSVERFNYFPISFKSPS